MKIGATSWLIIRGVALIISGYLAAVGMTSVCRVRNHINANAFDASSAGYGSLQIGADIPDAVYVAFFIVMAVWIFIACVFVWRNRTRLGVTLSAIAFSVFVLNAYNVLKFAYPVCNPF